MKVGGTSFEELLYKSWRLVWRNRWLWILGVFVGVSGLFFNFDFSGTYQKLSSDTGAGFSLGTLLSNTKALIANASSVFLAMIGIFVLVFIFFLISLIARSGLIKGISRVNNGESYKVTKLIDFGFKKTPRLLLMEIILNIVNAVFGIIFLISAFAFKLETARIVFIVAAVLFVLYNIFIILFKHYAYCYALLEDFKAWPAIKAGLQLLGNNFLVLLSAKAIEIGLLILLGLAIVISCLIILLPFAMIGFVLIISSGTAAMVAVSIVALLAIIAFLLLARGTMATYFQSFATYIYWQIKR